MVRSCTQRASGQPGDVLLVHTDDAVPGYILFFF